MAAAHPKGPTLWDKTYARFISMSRRLTDHQLMMVLACVVGVCAALSAYLLEALLHYIKAGLVSWFPDSEMGFLYLFYPTIGIIIASLFVKYIVRDDISEGVTRVLESMSSHNSRLRRHNMWTSVVGSGITIGFGGSVGPEAPIVLTGGAIGSNVGRFARLNYKQTTLLLCCGAGAAVAAIFKAPVAGIVFVLEILMFDLTSNTIIPLLLATVSATTLSFFLRGFDTVLAVNLTETFELRTIPMYVVLGIMCGLASYYFTSVKEWIGRFFGKFDKQYKKWIAGGVILGVLIFLFPTLYGEGYESFTSLMHGRTDNLLDTSPFYPWRDKAWVIALVLLATMMFKVVATMTTTASGGIGGTFAPCLFVGAYMGALIAFSCNNFLGMDLPIMSFTLVGMAGVMAGVMNAPLTGIFLIAELSGGYGLFIPLMIVSAVSYVIDYYLDPDSIYTKQLRERGLLLTHDKDSSVMVFLHVDELMETDFLQINTSYTLGDIVKIVQKGRRNIFPVVDDNEKLLGVVQLDDIRNDMFNPSKYDTRITEYMTQPPDRILPNEQTASVLKSFEANSTWMLPVVDKHGRYMGFISKSRILAAYRQQLVNITQ
ncbi:MAG: chloride channel protein [Rikenellaceae bacterium]|nr:chloride channel protein [Rikenellaceae bacterium]